MRSLGWCLVLAACGGKEATPSRPVAVTADAGVADAYVVFESMTGDGKGGLVVTQVTGAPPQEHNKQIIKRVVHTRHTEITACYLSERATNSALTGTVNIAFTISGDGDVVSVAATGMTATLDRCLEGEFQQLKFPKSTNGKPTTVTNYPITFKPAS